MVSNCHFLSTTIWPHTFTSIYSFKLIHHFLYVYNCTSYVFTVFDDENGFVFCLLAVFAAHATSNGSTPEAPGAPLGGLVAFRVDDGWSCHLAWSPFWKLRCWCDISSSVGFRRCCCWCQLTVDSSPVSMEWLRVCWNWVRGWACTVVWLAVLNTVPFMDGSATKGFVEEVGDRTADLCCQKSSRDWPVSHGFVWGIARGPPWSEG